MSTSDGRRYRVLRALGRGGFGTVFHAEMIGSGGFTKQVALKVLNPEMEGVEEIASRLRDEGRILGRLRHRAIVRVDGLVNFDGRWAVVMEYVEGADLHSLIEEEPIPVGPTLEILGEVAGALYAAYETSTSRDGEKLKLLHRDLKPANIQITPSGEVKVLDFGIARAQFDARESSTQSMRFGSLNYMSPERLDFIDEHGGDVYALGAVMYEMLVGEAVGKTSSNPERHQGVIEKALTKLREHGVDEGVVALIADCLAYEPSARPSARDIHRRCRELRRNMEGVWLSDWASDTLPALMSRRVYERDALCGAVLSEASGMGLINSEALRGDSFSESRRAVSHDTFVLEDGPLPPLEMPHSADSTDTVERPPPPRVLAKRFAPLAIGGLLLLVVGAGLMSSEWGTQAPTDPVTPVTPVTVEEPQGDDASVGGVDQEDVDEVPGDGEPDAEEGAGEDAATEATTDAGSDNIEPPGAEEGSATDVGSATDGGATSSGEGSTEGDDEEGDEGDDEGDEVPEPEIPMGNVVVTGDASGFWLIDAGGARLSPGAVPAGRYETIAVFPGKGEIANGPITVTDGGTVSLNCFMTFLRCK